MGGLALCENSIGSYNATMPSCYSHIIKEEEEKSHK